jgi:tetratricopeptide (TPR) repeat protein
MVAEPAPRQLAIASAAVRARRRYLMRYVAGAVTVAGIIGLAAVVRVTTARDASAAGSPWRAYVAAASLPAAAPTDDPIAPAGPQAGPAVEAPTAAGAVDPANPASEPQAAQDETADPPAPADVSPRAAADAKRDSQRAIDRGQVSAAIEAGEESVALDPTDADAWLVLGAAYQMKGRHADARRCFETCAEQARRGGRWECRALLR